MMTREDYKEGFTHFAETMIRMWRKGGDRDNQILLAMTHENFPEYFETYKHMFVLGFSTLDKFLIALLRSYMMVQIACISHDAPNDRRHEVSDIFNEIVTENFPEYFETYKHMFVLGFSTLDKFLIALLRSYMMVQIACISHDAPNDRRHEVSDIFNEIVTENLEKYKDILMTLHAPTYRRIEELHSSQLRFT